MKSELRTEIKIADNWIEQIEQVNDRFLIIDKKVFKIFSQKLQPIIESSRYYLYEASEQNKSFSSLQKILIDLQANKLNRNSTIVCIGGGITTDIGAFAASIYMRGCRLILIPTTFIGMIDAAIGGKTAINFHNIKNNLGTFYPAEKVIISIDFLSHLPEKELQNGWAECIKSALIKPRNLIDYLHEDDFDMLKIIAECIKIKTSIVNDDLHDTGSRRLLNLGHTFGHIIESVSGYKISHGESVSVGICSAAYISYRKEFLNLSNCKQIVSLFDKFNLPTKVGSKLTKEICQKSKKLLELDKKRTGSYNFVLLKDIGEVFIHSVEDADEILNLFCESLKGHDI